MAASWSETAIGQVGLGERRRLRRLSPADREERLRRLCGAGEDVEIVEAAVEGLEDLTTSMRIRCENRRYGSDLEGLDGYRMEFGGPWLEPPPELPDGPRRHPVVFDYPRVDTLQVDIAAPRGFEAQDAPPDAAVDCEYGGYALEFERTDGGFRVRRRLELHPLVIEPRGYETLLRFVRAVQRHDRTAVEFRRKGPQ